MWETWVTSTFTYTFTHIFSLFPFTYPSFSTFTYSCYFCLLPVVLLPPSSSSWPRRPDLSTIRNDESVYNILPRPQPACPKFRPHFSVPSLGDKPGKIIPPSLNPSLWCPCWYWDALPGYLFVHTGGGMGRNRMKLMLFLFCFVFFNDYSARYCSMIMFTDECFVLFSVILICLLFSFSFLFFLLIISLSLTVYNWFF